MFAVILSSITLAVVVSVVFRWPMSIYHRLAFMLSGCVAAGIIIIRLSEWSNT